MIPDKLQRLFLLGLLATITIVFLWMVSSFLIALIFAAIFSSLAQPLFRIFAKLLRGRKKWATVFTLLTVILVVVIPVLFLVGMVASQAVSVSQIVGPKIQSFLQQSHDLNTLFQKFPALKVLEPYSEFIFEKAGVVVGALGNYIFSSLSSITAGTVIFLLNIAIMIYAMFFFLSDGSAMLNRLWSSL
ncbi:MAG: AI-2E family transporter [Lentisphaerota bacterium]